MEIRDKIIEIFRRPKGNLEKWPDNNTQMINEINALNPECVLDLGCGRNLYKKHIPNLIGVDILELEYEDVTASIEDLPFADNTADVIICMGSVNFGDIELIRAQLREIKRVAKPDCRLYFRFLCNHVSDMYFDWNLDLVNQLGHEYGFVHFEEPKVITSTQDHERREGVGDRGQERLYVRWIVVKMDKKKFVKHEL